MDKAARLAARSATTRIRKPKQLLLGSVCYAESVGSIWKGMARHFQRQGLEVDFVLYSSYEAMLSGLLRHHIHIAWNGPLAHARLLRAAGTPLYGKKEIVQLGSRDVDRDFRTHIVVRGDAGIARLADLNARRLATGTVDSPQAYIMPLAFLAQCGEVDLSSLTVTRYDHDAVGKHGDTGHGETAVLAALAAGTCEAGFVSELMWKRAEAAGQTAELQILPVPVPTFDHCQFAALRSLSDKRAEAFTAALLAQNGSPLDDDKRTMALEGIAKEWVPPRAPVATADSAPGYERMLAALNLFEEPRMGPYHGHLHTPERHPFRHLIVDSALIRDSFGC